MSSIPEFVDGLKTKLDNLSNAGLYKQERALTGAQQVIVHADGKELLNFCSNNYLGLANNVQVITAAKAFDVKDYIQTLSKVLRPQASVLATLAK